MHTNGVSILNWNHPVKICLNSEGNLLIADKENDRLVIIDSDSFIPISEIVK